MDQGHPIRHTLTSSIPSTMCVTCHFHQGSGALANDYGYKNFYSSIDAMLMGRKTYEKALELGDHSYKEKKWFVFTRKKRSNAGNIEFVDEHSSVCKETT